MLAWRPLAFVGVVSYGLYLWHLIVFRVFKQHVHIVTMGEKLLWAPAMLAVTAILTIASYYPAHLQIRHIAVQVDPIQHSRSRPTCPSSTSFTVTIAAMTPA